MPSSRTAFCCRKKTDAYSSGFAEQRKFGLSKARHEWILALDTDERITQELREEIETLLADENQKCCGFFIPRLSTFLGKFIRHSGWYPGHQLRLFLKSKTCVTDRAVHEGYEVQGETGHLQHYMEHHTHQTLSESFDRLSRYSQLEALDRLKRNKRVHWWDFLTHPLSAFFNKFIALKGYKDGMHGFMIALITAALKMAMYMQLWALQQEQERSPQK